MHKYIICGPQGSGKGTQSRLLSQAHDFVHISVGDMFRWHMQHHTKVAARITRIMHSGHLVSDDIVEKVVRERLEQHDFNFGFVLDGFPRTRSQAEYLFENWDVDRVIYLDIPDEIVVERVMQRAKKGLGSGFTKRADDNPAALKVRLEEYYGKTKPLLELYRQKERLVTVDGTKAISSVYSDISSALGLSPLRPAADALAKAEAGI